MRNLLELRDSDNFDTFILKLCATFEYDVDRPFEVRLYHVAHEASWSNRTRIDSLIALRRIAESVSTLAYNRKGAFYCDFGADSPEASPNGSPLKSLTLDMGVPASGLIPAEFSSSRSSNVVERLSADTEKTEQTEKTQLTTESEKGKRNRRAQEVKVMREKLASRDPVICRVCRRTDSVECAHVIDVQYKVSLGDLVTKFSLNDCYDFANGLFLCSSCNKSYDNFIIGILPTGDVTRPGSGIKYENIFDGLPQIDSRTVKCLEYKFGMFVKAQEVIRKRKLGNGLSAKSLMKALSLK